MCPVACSRAGPGQAGSSGGGEAGAGAQLEDVGHAFEEFLRFAEELQEQMVPGAMGQPLVVSGAVLCLSAGACFPALASQHVDQVPGAVALTVPTPPPPPPTHRMMCSDSCPAMSVSRLFMRGWG